jgi:hypothetical protein
MTVADYKDGLPIALRLDQPKDRNVDLVFRYDDPRTGLDQPVGLPVYTANCAAKARL